MSSFNLMVFKSLINNFLVSPFRACPELDSRDWGKNQEIELVESQCLPWIFQRITDSQLRRTYNRMAMVLKV